MESGDWTTGFPAHVREKIANKILNTLKRHLPFSGDEGLQELKSIAERYEERVYTSATCQNDYLRKISLKMLHIETGIQDPTPDEYMMSNSTASSVNP